MGKAKRLRTAQYQARQEAEAIRKGLERVQENMEECMDKPIIEALGGLSSKVPKPPEGHGLL